MGAEVSQVILCLKIFVFEDYRSTKYNISKL